jgi:hypothetical protein
MAITLVVRGGAADGPFRAGGPGTVTARDFASEINALGNIRLLQNLK